MPGPPGAAVSLLSNRQQGSSASSVSLDQLERTGRRITMLQRYAPELVSSSATGAVAMAQSNMPDPAMLNAASDAVGYANVQRLLTDLQDESDEGARGIWASTPEPLQTALSQMGYKPPPPPQKKGHRWGINLPDFLPGPDELTIARSTPIIGPLGNVQAGLGEGLQALGSATEVGLKPFQWLGEQPAHLYRTWKYIQQESDSAALPDYFAASNFSKAWHATDEEDGYIRPEYRERARKALGGDDTSYRLAHYMAMKLDPADVLEKEGLEPGTAEATDLIMRLQQMSQAPEFKQAVHDLSVGSTSVGRVFTQEFGLDDTDNGWGRYVSGALDAGFVIASDPTMVAGKLTKGFRLGRAAFLLEDAGDVERGMRMAKVGQLILDANEGVRDASLVADVGKLRPWEMARGKSVLRWADRVSEGFKTGELSRLQREVPGVATAISAMADYDAKGQGALQTSRGVLEWLQGAQGTLAIAGSRLGGGSPLVEGLRIPTLTTVDRATLRSKAVWTKVVDWSRLRTDPFHGSRVAGEAYHWNDYFKNVLSDLGNPVNFSQQMARWSMAHTAGSAGKVLAALTAHTPYEDVLPLFGEKAVPEFTRLVNTGIFAGFTRQMMDDYVDDFIKHPELVNRSGKVEEFLDQLFTLGGVQDTGFKERFVGRMRQAYAIDGGDTLHVNGIETRAARLVDAQHADALAIPNVKQFLGESYRANWLRAMFHNPGAAAIDTRLGRAWKPAVLMRIGFIPRAAGEELFHYILKHGPRSYAGTKGAEWVVQEELGHKLRSQLSEALDLGQHDLANRIEQQLAETVGALPPIRAMMAGSDRMFSRLMASSSESVAPWRRHLYEKAEDFTPMAEGGTRGVVTGLERFANRISIRSHDVWSKVAESTHMPSKAQLGDWMAKHWDPHSLEAARDMIDHPWIMRAYAEEISGATMSPLEFRNVEVLDGVPVRKMRIGEIRGGMPVVEDVPMRPLPGDYSVKSRTAQDEGFYQSIYARHKWVMHDRVGESVATNVLPRFVGGPEYPKLARKLGFGADLAGLRGDLNTAWAHIGPSAEGKSLLWHVRRFVDGEEPDNGVPWLGAQLKKLFEDSGTGIGAGKFLGILEDPKVPMAAKRWMLYEDVDPARLIEDFPSLVRKMRNTARGRLSRADLNRHLSESRLYANGGPTLATPIAKGMHKVYVPLMPADYEAIGLGEDFVKLATQRIVRIGAYDPATAEAIARRVAATSGGIDIPEMALKPLAQWGANDPRVTDAVMAAVEQVTKVKPTFGILSVPDSAVQRSAGQFPQGLVADSDAWQQANDFSIDAWRLMHTTPTGESRRLTQLEVGGDWWDEAALDAATDAWHSPPGGTTRHYSYDDGRTWTTTPVGSGTISGTGTPVRFVDTVGPPAPEDLAAAHKLPGEPPAAGWSVAGRQVSPGLGEIEALERVGDASVDEMLETLTTAGRQDIDEDVLHEVVEPMLRPDRRFRNAAGNEQVEPGYTWEHLVAGTPVDRLPVESYGPNVIGARDLHWRKFVQEFFSGPVNRAISSVVRKPMFLHIYGQQMRNTRMVADLFVDGEVRAATVAGLGKIGLPEESIDDIVLNVKHATTDDDIKDLVMNARGLTWADEHGRQTAWTSLAKKGFGDEDIGALKFFARQRNHGLDLARENAVNRTFELITPFIDDHRVRSAFQNYVGNFIPFLFAEEQFLKRWARSVAESPEMIRKAQLGLNGLRAQGTVRKDNQGNEIFVWPVIGEATQALINTVPDVFGVDLKLPDPIQMTGDVGYTLPGFGQQLGTPSAGPLVGMGVEFLSRHYPELADLEDDALGRGANRSLWQYIVPTSVGNLWQGAFGDMDKGQLASLNLQAIQNMAIAGQLPPEDATPREREHFLEQVRGQVRALALVRAGFGMLSPASPQITFKSEDLSEEFNKLLQADLPIEEAVLAFVQNHPDMQPTDLLSVTTSKTETEFSGLDMPTDKAFGWLKEHQDLVDGYPAATSWLMPRADDDDSFSFRAWNQQIAVGLRKRKAPDEFLDDIYFTTAARDYFDTKQRQEERMLTATGETKRQYTVEWDAWKAAYFNQHPVFEQMLSDTTRQHRRQQALEELTTLAADPESEVVPDDMREMVQRYDEYKQNTSLMRGDRRGAVVTERKRLTEELRTWMLWHIAKHPSLAPLYMRTIEPELGETDEDAVATGLVSN